MLYKKEEKTKILSPKIDVVFQNLFGEEGCENITKDFLNSILDEKIQEINLQENVILRREKIDEKIGIVDVLAKINDNEYCDIEIQVLDKKKIIERLLFYWAKIYSRTIKKGQDYYQLKKTIIVLIADFEIKELKGLAFHSKWKIIEEKNRKKVLTDVFEAHIIEIPKIYKIKEAYRDKELIKWICFLENPNSKEVSDYMKDNKNIKEAKDKLDVMSKDEKMRKLAELREKAIMDEKLAEYTGYTNGHEEGMKEGIEQTAKKMKEEKIDISIIMKVTGLSKQDIEKL